MRIPLRALPSAEQVADVEVFRPFFTAGIVCVLTAGCTLGAVALAGIARNGSYTASAWTPWVLAHANSQLYGWIGLFVMGFALQQHQPSADRVRAFYAMAWASLGLALVGIVMRFAAEPMAASGHGWGVPLGVASAGLQLGAVLLFAANLGTTGAKGARRLGDASPFVLASLFWWLVVAAVEPWVFAASHGPDAVAFVATWFGPYREAQFLGFVSQMVFGVAMTKFHTCFAMRESSRRLAIGAVWIWNLGLVARGAGWVLYKESQFDTAVGVPYLAGATLLGMGAVTVVCSLGVFEAPSEPMRSHRFLHAAFGWLLVSAVMMALEPLHLNLAGVPFSHAYTGAVRHALTVGFLSQTVLGVSMHVAARMRGIDTPRLPRLSAVFWLLNIGNGCRVVLEVATEYTPRAFAPMGLTGFVELTALLIWGVHMLRVMATKEVPHAA